MDEFTGWVLDVFSHPRDGLVLYFLAEDGARLRLHTPFPVTFYAAGPSHRLRQLWRALKKEPPHASLARRERRDLFAGMQPVLAVEVPSPDALPPLFQRLQSRFPDLTWYDVDIPLALRFWVQSGAFPLAYCRVEVGEDARLLHLEPLEAPWTLHPLPVPLSILHIVPEQDPRRELLRALRLTFGARTYRLSLTPSTLPAGLYRFKKLLLETDPDLLLTSGGDTHLLPLLLNLGRQWGVDLPLNRERDLKPLYKKALTYFSYGQIMYRGRQVLLFGRLHIDRENAFLFKDYGLEGVLETARLTGLPVQTAARVSPGSGISAMEMLTALREGILVPWRKQEAERPRPAQSLFYADQGGLVYQPIVGVHRDVVGIDFVSMYPALMVRFNLSPETVGPRRAGARRVPELDLWVTPSPRGLIPRTLAPLLKKRVLLKTLLAKDLRGFRRRLLQARAAAQKWLLVTCFGYLGYKNARFGRIEAHQAVTAYGREVLLQAKEAAEAMGFRVLHMMVDGLWVQKEGVRTAADVQPLLEAIEQRTGLLIAVEGVYRWIVFPPSRQDPRVPVPTRYFGVFQDGSLKVRGIAARRRDTAPFIAETQMGVLHRLAQAPDLDALPAVFPTVRAYLQEQERRLREGLVPPEDLVMTYKLHREVAAYRSRSPVARAAAQLRAAGKDLRPGQRIRLVFTRGEPGVWAWDLPERPDPAAVDTARYLALLERAASEILEPLGIEKDQMASWIADGSRQLVLM